MVMTTVISGQASITALKANACHSSGCIRAIQLSNGLDINLTGRLYGIYRGCWTIVAPASRLQTFARRGGCDNCLQ